MPLPAFSACIVSDSAQDTGEETVRPFACCVIERTVKIILVDGFRIDNMGDAFDSIYPSKRIQKDAPRFTFSASRWTNKHDAMRYLLYLIELDQLFDPGIIFYQMPFFASAMDRRSEAFHLVVLAHDVRKDISDDTLKRCDQCQAI